MNKLNVYILISNIEWDDISFSLSSACSVRLCVLIIFLNKSQMACNLFSMITWVWTLTNKSTILHFSSSIDDCKF